MKRKEGNRKRPGGSDTIVLSLDGKSGDDNQQRVPVQYLICFSDQLPCTCNQQGELPVQYLILPFTLVGYFQAIVSMCILATMYNNYHLPLQI